jgi:ketosteroid isomerase-like protein
MSELSEIRRVLALFAQRIDDRNIDGLVALFTPDARVESPHGVFRGHAKIREWLQNHFAKQPTDGLEQNQIANAVLTVGIDGRTAEGRSDDLCFRSQEGTPWELQVVSRHHDKLAKVQGRWLFSEKAIEIRGQFERTSVSVPNAILID